MIYGLDLSRHNFDRFSDGEKPDWKAIKAAGYLFVVFKLTEGVNYIDPYAFEMAKEAQEAGLLVTFYHFATPGGSKVSGGYKAWWDASDEAEDFLEALAKSGVTPDLKVALDFEWKDEHLEGVGMDDPVKLTQWAVEWIIDVKNELGYFPQFYTYPSYMNKIIVPEETINSCPLWLSHFTNDILSPPRFKDEWGWEKYIVWQYTSSGEVDGLIGNTDLNIAEQGLDEISLAPCGLPLSAQMDQSIANIEKELEALRAISASLKAQGQ